MAYEMANAERARRKQFAAQVAQLRSLPKAGQHGA